MTPEEERQAALNSYRAKLIESREWEAKLKNLRIEIKDLEKEFNRTEDNIKALQSVGQIIGEVLKQLDEERCTSPCALAQRESDSRADSLQLSSRHHPDPDMSSAVDPRSTR